MKDNNWLLRYTSLEGIEKTLTEMGSRIGREYELEKSVINLDKHYDFFKQDFEIFFADIEVAAKAKRIELLST